MDSFLEKHNFPNLTKYRKSEHMQNTSCKMPGWMKLKLESRLPGEISITSDMQMTLPLAPLAYQVALVVTNPPATEIPGLEDPLAKEMATHCNILAWKIPWTEEPGRLQSMGSQRVGHD